MTIIIVLHNMADIRTEMGFLEVVISQLHIAGFEDTVKTLSGMLCVLSNHVATLLGN